MGGLGSGRFGRRSSRLTTREVAALRLYDVLPHARGRRWWSGAVCGISLDDDGMDGTLRLVDGGATIRLSATVQPTGGRRWWLHCPRCNARCAILYHSERRLDYACRKCLRLVFHSQRLSPSDRLLSRARKYYARAECHSSDSYHYRPKGMHWRTFHRAIDRAEALFDRAFLTDIAPLLQRCGYAV